MPCGLPARRALARSSQEVSRRARTDRGRLAHSRDDGRRRHAAVALPSARAADVELASFTRRRRPPRRRRSAACARSASRHAGSRTRKRARRSRSTSTPRAPSTLREQGCGAAPAASAGSSTSISASRPTTATPTARTSSPGASPATRSPRDVRLRLRLRRCLARDPGFRSRSRAARATTTRRCRGDYQAGRKWARDTMALAAYLRLHGLDEHAAVRSGGRRRAARDRTFHHHPRLLPRLPRCADRGTCSTTTARSTAVSAASGTRARPFFVTGGHEVRAGDPQDLQPRDGERVGGARPRRATAVLLPRAVRRRDDDAPVAQSRHEAARRAQGARPRARRPQRRPPAQEVPA